MDNLINFLKIILVRSILFFQFINHRILRRRFSKDRFELLKHSLNFYSFNSKKESLKLMRNIFLKVILRKIFWLILINLLALFFILLMVGPALKSAMELFNYPKISRISYLFRFYKILSQKIMENF